MGDSLFSIFFFMLALCILFLLGFIAYSSLAASGEVSYCYIEAGTDYNGTKSNGTWKLVGFRDWRSDVTISIYDSFDAAVDGAKKINCRLGVKSE